MKHLDSMVAIKDRGFSLLEVLIALLVLSFGLLGLAALQIKSLQSSHAGYQRMLASIIAMDASERIWANQAAPADDRLTVAQLQAAWLNDWTDSSNNRQILPGFAGTLVENPVSFYTINIAWDDSRFVNEDAPVLVYTMETY